MWEWLYYNFAAGRFHTKKRCSRLYSIEIEFYSKTKNRFLSHPLRDLGVAYTLSIPRWKAFGRLPIAIHHN